MRTRTLAAASGIVLAAVAALWLRREARSPAPETSVATPSAPASSRAAIELEPRSGERQPAAASPQPREPEPPSPLPGPLDALASCVLASGEPTEATESMARIRACLADIDLAEIEAPALASWLCSHDPSSPARQVLIEQASIRRSPGEFLRFVDELQDAICDEMTERLPQAAALLWAESNDPAWLAEVQASIDAQALFGGASDGVVLMAEYFVERGDARIAAMLAAGARGELGGTPEQMVRAANVVAVHEDRGEPYLAFCASLLDSPATTPDELMGNHLLAFTLRDKASLDGNWRRSIALVERMLDDPRFAVEAASQLLAQHTRQPQGFPDSEWERLLARARILLGR